MERSGFILTRVRSCQSSRTTRYSVPLSIALHCYSLSGDDTKWEETQSVMDVLIPLIVDVVIYCTSYISFFLSGQQRHIVQHQHNLATTVPTSVTNSRPSTMLLATPSSLSPMTTSPSFTSLCHHSTSYPMWFINWSIPHDFSGRKSTINFVSLPPFHFVFVWVYCNANKMSHWKTLLVIFVYLSILCNIMTRSVVLLLFLLKFK